MEKIICGIYKIINPKNKIYIGQSTNIYKRWFYYDILNCKNQPRLYQSLKKYGNSSHIFEIIEECDFNLLNERERYWQDHYDVLDRKKGLNCVLTKTKDKKTIINDLTKNKIKNSLKNFNEEKIKHIYQYNLSGECVKIWKNYNEVQNSTEYDRGYISRCCNGRTDKAYEFIWSYKEQVFSNEFLNKVSLTKSDKLKGNRHNLGRKLTNEHKEKLRISLTDFKHSDETKKIIAKIKSKPIIQFDLNGTPIKEWESATIAGIELKMLSQNISKCCNGKQKTAHGFIWKFKKNTLYLHNS